MRNHTTSALALALILVGANESVAEEIASTSLLSQQNWVRLSIVLGRVHVEATCSGRSKSAQRSDPAQNIRETLNVSFHEGCASLRYELASPDQLLIVKTNAGKDFEIIRQPGETEAGETEAALLSLHFYQKSGEPIFLVLGEGDSRREYSAVSLWHLLLAQEEVCREHLIPILESLRPSWRFVERTRELQDALIVLAESGSRSRRDQWKQWVSELASDDFRQRRLATGRLREAGQAVLVYFDSLDPALLDAEQKLRIADVRKVLTVSSGDTPGRLAAWLIEDPKIWLILLSHEELIYRQVAYLQLSRIQGRSIKFDPRQTEPLRQAQIERLRRRSIVGN